MKFDQFLNQTKFSSAINYYLFILLIQCLLYDIIILRLVCFIILITFIYNLNVFQNTQTTLDGTDVKSTQEVLPSLPKTKIEKKINEEVKKIMGEIFACIEPELIAFIQYHERMDST